MVTPPHTHTPSMMFQSLNAESFGHQRRNSVLGASKPPGDGCTGISTEGGENQGERDTLHHSSVRGGPSRGSLSLPRVKVQGVD